MRESIFFGDRSRALQTEIVRRQGGDRATFLVRRCLRDNWTSVEYAAQYHLVVRYAAIHKLLALGEKKLHMFCCRVSFPIIHLSCMTLFQGIFLPHPNTGKPGTGDLTRAFLGDAGVTGRLGIVEGVAERASA